MNSSGKNYYIPSNIAYNEWKQRYVKKNIEHPSKGNYTVTNANYKFLTGQNQKAIIYKKDGTEFIYPENYNKDKQRISPEKAMAVFEEIPKELSKNIKKIEFVDFRNPDDYYWEQEYGIEGFVSYATGGNGKITFYINEHNVNSKVTILETYLHEGGHILEEEYERITGTNISETKKYKNAMLKDSILTGELYVSEYAKEAESEAEDFAEFIKEYYLDKKYYEIMFPARVKVLKEVLKTVEQGNKI